MKNITLTAQEYLIEAAREKARSQHTTLNEAFREWLQQYVGQAAKADQAMLLVKELRSRAKTGGRRFTRDEMNER